METVVQRILSCEANKLDELQKYLDKEKELIEKHLSLVDEALDTLDFHTHTLGALHLLAAQASSSKLADKHRFIQKAIRLVHQGSSAQLALDPSRFAQVCRRLATACQETNNSIKAVKPLQVAIQALHQPTYKAALPLLDKWDYKLNPQATGVTGEDVRLYCYYGGICYIADKQFGKALQALENVISAPAIMASAIMVEAYKKYILASLIHTGEIRPLPKYTSQSVMRMIKQLCAPYEDLATAFSTRSVENLIAAIENHNEVFLQQNNLGLVGQVLAALKTQNIIRMTKTYTTVSLSAIAEKHHFNNVEEAEVHILKMIESGHLRASINTEHGYVSFVEDESYRTNDIVEYLGQQIKTTMRLHHQISAFDRSIELSDSWLKRQLLQDKGGAGHIPYDPELMDREFMADVSG